MDEYLGKAIPQMIARVKQSLELIPTNLSNEQLVLAQKCTTEIHNALKTLEYLANDLEINLPQNCSERLREFQRTVRDIEYVETIGIAALERANEPDERLNRLVQHIRQEISYPLPLPPVITTLSRDYFYIHTRFNFNLVCVPPGERNSLLHMPDLYHELAHPLLLEKHLPRVQPFQQGLVKVRDLVLKHFYTELQQQERQRGPDIYKTYLERWMQNWYRFWAIEFLCDLFAIYTLGPAFAWAHLHLCAKKTENPFEFSEKTPSKHPADDARMRLMLYALDRIGFADDANSIEERWRELITSLSISKEPEYGRCYPQKLIVAIEEIAYPAVLEMRCRIAAPETSNYVHAVLNSAWYEFWRDRNSYAEWEKQQVALLYQYCTGTLNKRLMETHYLPSNNSIRDMQKMNVNDDRVDTNHTSEKAKTIFLSSLVELLTDTSTNEHLIKEYPLLASEDLLRLKLEMSDPPRGGIYDHVVFERKFYLSEKLISAFSNYWKQNGIDENTKKRMCKLFFLHEFLHTSQHVDSNTYIYSKNSKNSFRYIDYDADAFAVKVCFLSERHYSAWNIQLADILAAHIKGGEVFSYADDGRSQAAIEGERLQRQIVWHLQYARARAFKPESEIDSYNIEQHVLVEIFKVTENENRENLCLKRAVTAADLKAIIEIHFVWGGKRIRYHLTNPHYTENLAEGIFESDLDKTAEAFRPLFDEHPELIGRSTATKLSGIKPQYSTRTDNTIPIDRTEFIEKLYTLHLDDLSKIISAIPSASQRVSSDQTLAKKVELLISWSESGTGPGLRKLFDIADKLFPLHFH